MQGYKGTTGSFIPPAVIPPNGCCLPQKKPDNNGYVKIRPVAVFTGHALKDGPKKIRDKYQHAHRVVCYLTKCDEDVHNMLYRGYEVSHLCHQPRCINADHLVVETHKDNDSRRICAVKVDIKILVDGRDYILDAEECPHSPRCIIRLDSRAAIEL
ncbi:zinc-binding loop region of homing endonuclease-domain-containing protein [Lipomyces mesembrius]